MRYALHLLSGILIATGLASPAAAQELKVGDRAGLHAAGDRWQDLHAVEAQGTLGRAGVVPEAFTGG